MQRRPLKHPVHYVFLFCMMLFPLVALPAFAADVSETNKYAWAANAGWINFNPTHGTVRVFGSHLEGYAWGENIGWIRMGTHAIGGAHTYANTDATDYGVNNDGAGNLSGYAWGTNVGWINFSPTHGGVTIDPDTGDFEGFAWGENVGWIKFKSNSPAYRVSLSDDPPPPPDVIGAPSGTRLRQDETITFGPNVAEYQYSLDGGDLSGFISSQTPLVLSALDLGPHTLEIKVKNPLGGVTTYTYNWTVKLFPIISTDGVTDITQTGATMAGAVDYNPELLCTRQLPSGFRPEGCQSLILASGVTWAEHRFPRTYLNPLTDNGAEIGPFTARITGLEPGKTYYARTYVTYRVPGNIVPAAYTEFTDYGEELSFTTPPEPPGLRQAMMILQLLAGVEMVGGGIAQNADVDADGVFGISDVIAILKRVAGEE